MKTHHVSRETLFRARERYGESSQKHEDYLDSLLWWNERVNLVSRNVSRETLREHIVHSLIALELSLLNGCEVWLDAGSGGGLPGIPLSLSCESQRRWILNDLAQKKVMAVRQMISLLGLEHVEVVGGSVEQIDMEQSFGVISKHAFSAEKLVALLGEKPWKRLVMYKGVEEAVQECFVLEGEFNCSLYKFQFGEDEPFYQKKGLLVIDRK